MNKKLRNLLYGSVIAAIYAALCFFQDTLFPGSASDVIQYRAAEALCILALFTPAAVPGLTLGCLLFNALTMRGLPVDLIVGTLATLLSLWGMRLTRHIAPKGLPVLAFLCPVIGNGLLVGGEISYFTGMNLFLSCLYVAIGEGLVMFTLGAALYWLMKNRGLDKRLFG